MGRKKTKNKENENEKSLTATQRLHFVTVPNTPN